MLVGFTNGSILCPMMEKLNVGNNALAWWLLSFFFPRFFSLFLDYFVPDDENFYFCIDMCIDFILSLHLFCSHHLWYSPWSIILFYLFIYYYFFMLAVVMMICVCCWWWWMPKVMVEVVVFKPWRCDWFLMNFQCSWNFLH